MLNSVWGNDPMELVISNSGGGGSSSLPHPVYYNPRASAFFADYPPEVGQISDLIEYNILGTIIRRGEFSPTYDGIPTDPPGNAWRADAHTPIIWDGDPIDVKIELYIALGRQIPQEVDARLFIKQNGVEISGASVISSLSRSPTGGTGTSSMSLVVYTTLATGDTIEPLINRVGNDPTTLTDINIFSATVNITALYSQKLPILSFP